MLLVQELKAKHREVMQDVLMDVLRALTSPNMDIRKKTLDIALDLITSRNIDEVKQCVIHTSLPVCYAARNLVLALLHRVTTAGKDL